MDTLNKASVFSGGESFGDSPVFPIIHKEVLILVSMHRYIFGSGNVGELNKEHSENVNWLFDKVKELAYFRESSISRVCKTLGYTMNLPDSTSQSFSSLLKSLSTLPIKEREKIITACFLLAAHLTDMPLLHRAYFAYALLVYSAENEPMMINTSIISNMSYQLTGTDTMYPIKHVLSDYLRREIGGNCELDNEELCRLYEQNYNF